MEEKREKYTILSYYYRGPRCPVMDQDTIVLSSVKMNKRDGSWVYFIILGLIQSKQ